MIDRPGAALPVGWHDLSPPISSQTAVFPGDVPFSRRVSMAIERGDHLTLSDVATTLHVGAHADAPSHYVRDGAPIDGRALARYVGAAQVFLASPGCDGRVDVDAVLGRGRPRLRAPRVLLRTDTFPNPERWHDGFASLTPALIDALADRGVVLIGIDTPSVDPATAKELTAHAAVARRDLAILEGLDLRGVAPGLWTLIAAPLRIVGADAAPVRALIVPPVRGLGDPYRIVTARGGRGPSPHRAT